VWCLWEDDKCQAKGTCTDHYSCTSPLVIKMSFPMTCHGVYCNDTDCCGHPGKCSDADCEGPELVLKNVLPDKCKKVTCDEAECCDKNKSHPSPAPSGGTATALHSTSDGHAILLDSGFDSLDLEHASERHAYQVEGMEDTPAGRREPFAHSANLRQENDNIAQAKAEWAKMLEEDSQAQLLEEDENFKRSDEDEEEEEKIDYSVPRTASSWWGKYIGGKYVELGFRTWWGVGKMGTWGSKPPGFTGRVNGWGMGMVVNAKGFGGGGDSVYCTVDTMTKGHACGGRRLWDWHIPLDRCMGYCKRWWWWGCKCITWRHNHWRSCRMETGTSHSAHSDGNAYSAMTTAEWDAKCAQAQTIDYFMPGSPEEGFYAGYKQSNSWWGYRKKNFGTSIEVSKDDEFCYATITGDVGNLRVTQTITLGLEDKWFRNDITMENTGSATLKEARFMRSFDPDNTVDQGGWYSTEQQVLNCGGPPDAGEDLTPCPKGGVAVSAQSRDDSYAKAVGSTAKVVYYADHEYAWAAFGNWGLAPWSVFDSRVWAPRNKADDTDSARQWGYWSVAAPGEKITRDAWIAICFNIPELASGEKVDLVYWTGMDLLSIPKIAQEIYDASDGPKDKFPSCEEHKCVWGTILKFEAPLACTESAGWDECRNDECCDPLQKCEDFVCSDFGDYKHSATMNFYCNNTVCDDTHPTEGVNDDLDTCCEKGCSQFGEDACPITRNPNTCTVFNNECVDACSTYETVTACEDQARCAVVPIAMESQNLCADRGDCARESHVCTAPLVPKATYPDWCGGVECTDDDCCGVAGICTEEDCDEDYRIKLHPPVCATTVCTNDECCFGWPASIAAHFGKNTGLATVYDFMINCTLVFPYVEMRGGDSALSLHVAVEACNFQCYLDRYVDLQNAFGKTNVVSAEHHWFTSGRKEKRNCHCPDSTTEEVIDLQDDAVCRISGLAAQIECTWMYDYNTNSIRAQDRKLCHGDADWDCCLKWDDNGKMTAEKCSVCLAESSLVEGGLRGEEKCKWCNLIIDDISRNMVMMPMTQGSCKDTEKYCSTAGNKCRCMAGQDNSNKVSLATLTEADLQQGLDSTSAKDCRMRFAGIPTAEELTTSYGSDSGSRTIAYNKAFADADAEAMEEQILDTTGEETLSAICMTAAMNNLIVAPGTAYVWPSSFLDRHSIHHAKLVSGGQDESGRPR